VRNPLEVVIVHRRLAHYREPLFALLRALLLADGVHLRLLHGGPTADEARKGDEGRLNWAEHVKTHYFLDGRLCWQAFGACTRNADLVIVTQENRLLYNLWAIFVGRPRGNPRRIAFWGHGANFQAASPHGWRERLKRRLIRHVDWWFAYTQLSVDIVRDAGFPADRITRLENAIDTRALAEQVGAVSRAELDAAIARLNLQGARVGLFLGSLYDLKRLPFLLDAADLVVAQVPSFRLLVSGDGPQRPMIEAAARTRPWLRVLGVQRGRDKAIALRLAEVMLNPGLVGLGILDAFTAGLPIITTDCHIHSPEIAYLQSGENGIMTPDSTEAFASAVIALLNDEAERRRLGANAQAVAGRYTIEDMAQRFRAGILRALNTKP
jgi:glycosyltransferase involved in cell wall biosynthesis